MDYATDPRSFRKVPATVREEGNSPKVIVQSRLRSVDLSLGNDNLKDNRAFIFSPLGGTIQLTSCVITVKFNTRMIRLE